jgi:hypothetical protein
MASPRKRSGNWAAALAVVAGAFVALCPLGAEARRNADDYASSGLRASSEARAVFGIVKDGAPGIWVSRGGSGGGASFTEDGGISIPPGAMVEFEYTGQCMDPHLPAPAQGEPMQFVDTAELIPARLRKTYENLLALQAAGDPRITSSGMQQLVWALRTAGTAGSVADNLSEEQRRLLDACSGRKNGFTRYHEKEKARNAKRGSQERISVGNLSYDASDLRGEEAGARIQSHVDELVAMGRDAGVAGASGFRYAEIEEELYTDIVSEGGLSVKARVLNASGRTRVFRPADCAAQAGDGSVSGSRRQRVAMNIPDKVRIVPDALGQEMQTDWEASSSELEGTEWHRRTERRRETRTVRVAESIPAVSPPPPVSPVTPVEPVPVVTNTVTNTLVRVVPEEVDARVVGVEYDPEARRGVLKVEVRRGSFQKAFRYIRSNFGDLLQRDGRAAAVGIPPGTEWNIDGISINGEDVCEVHFSALESPDS